MRRKRRARSAPASHSRLLLPLLLVVLLLGVLAGVALADGGSPGGTTTDQPATTANESTTDPVTTTAPVTTTDPGTTTDPVTTTDPGTTTAPATTSDPGTTTAPATTTDPATTTAPTTTADTTTTTAPTTNRTTTTTPTTTGVNATTTTGTGAGNSSSVGQKTGQGQVTTPVTTTPPTTTTPPPTAPCDSTQITCGNNAATQVALVTQTCNASSTNSSLDVKVENLSGQPINSFTVQNNTTCLNEVSISQVVQQFCVGCTVIVIPPPTIQSVYVTQVFPQAAGGGGGGTTGGTGSGGGGGGSSTPTTQRAAYCMPQPVQRADGSWGTFVDLLAGQPQWDSRYRGATPAVFQQGVGLTCPDGESTPTGQTVPVFTLTVPVSFVGQYVQLCLQPSNASKAPQCHLIRIDTGATISVPVTGHVTAVVKQAQLAPGDKPKSAKQIAAATSAIAQAVGPHHTTKHHSTTTRKGKK